MKRFLGHKKSPERPAFQDDPFIARLKERADHVEPPLSLSPAYITKKLPSREKNHFPFASFSRRIAPYAALAACFAVVLAGVRIYHLYGESKLSGGSNTTGTDTAMLADMEDGGTRAYDSYHAVYEAIGLLQESPSPRAFQAESAKEDSLMAAGAYTLESGPFFERVANRVHFTLSQNEMGVWTLTLSDEQTGSPLSSVTPEFRFPTLDGLSLSWQQASGFYLENETLVILGAAGYQQNADIQKVDLSQNGREVLSAVFYDVKDPENPRFLSSLAQDGELNSSVLADGSLKIVTSLSYPSGTALPDEGSPAGFIPSTYGEDGGTVIKRERIALASQPAEAAYQLFSAVTLSKPEGYSDVLCYFGGGEELILSENGYYSVFSNQMKSASSILYIGTQNEVFSVSGEASVPGRLLAADADADGVLRVVTAEDDLSLHITLFSPEMENLGSLTLPTEGSAVSSAYFDGSRIFLYSWEQADPVWTIDCSDPHNPKRLTEKIDDQP